MDTKGNRKKTVIAIAVFLIVVIVLYLRIYIAPKVSDIFVEDYTAEYGTLDVDADQTLLLSDANGDVIDRMLLTAQRQDISFGRVYSELPTLNNVFLEITGKELRD